MLSNKKILAIIPARGGSKGITRKNIKELNRKPLIAYTIEAAKKSKYIDKIVVSTEDEEIAKISESFGANVPYLRPGELAKDDTPGLDPILHCIQWHKDNSENYDYAMCLQCTSPMRTVQQIDEAIDRLINSDYDALVSVCESEISPYWMKKVEDGILKDFVEEAPFYARRQDMPKVYRLNGAIYIAKTEMLINLKTWYSEKTLPYIMDNITSTDIDNLLDFKFAEFLMKEKENEK